MLCSRLNQFYNEVILPQMFQTAKDYALVLSACVSHVVGPAQPSVHKVTVLGFGEEQDQEKVFVASPEQGKGQQIVNCYPHAVYRAPDAFNPLLSRIET